MELGQPFAKCGTCGKQGGKWEIDQHKIITGHR